MVIYLKYDSARVNEYYKETEKQSNSVKFQVDRREDSVVDEDSCDSSRHMVKVQDVFAALPPRGSAWRI